MQRSFKQGAGKRKLSFILVETLQKQPLLSSWMLKIHFLSNVNINLLSNLQFMRVVIMISNYVMAYILCYEKNMATFASDICKISGSLYSGLFYGERSMAIIRTRVFPKWVPFFAQQPQN